MNAQNWNERRQWTARIRRDGVVVDIIISREGKVPSWTWWLDPVVLGGNPEGGNGWTLGSEYCASPALSLTEAKRRSVEHADDLASRVLKARGGL